MKLNIHNNIHLAGIVQCSIINAATKDVVRHLAPQKNLILNQGMNNVAAFSFAKLMDYCAAGSGTYPNRINGGDTVATQNGTTVTLEGGAYQFANTATDAGKMIKWDSGEEARIVTVQSPTTATVANNAQVSGSFTIWHTQQTALQTEIKRSNTYLPGAGNSETLYGENNGGSATVTHTRTFDFSAETEAATYTEVGFSHVPGASGNINARILLADPVALIADQQLRVKYSLVLTVSPTEPQIVNPSPIIGWPTATGTQMIQRPAFDYVFSPSGVTVKYDNSLSHLEPSQAVGGNTQVLLSSVALPHNPYNSNGPNRFTNSFGKMWSNLAYSSFSYYVEKTVTFTTTQGNRSDWRSIMLGINSSSAYYFCYLLDTAQEKLSTHTLTLTFRFSWSRTLA